MKKPNPSPRDRYFRFLTRLSQGGRSNMYGAVPYLASAFALDRDQAFRVVCEWLDARAAASASPPGSRTPLPAGSPKTVVASKKPSVKRKRPGVKRAA
jgi:hypothetical protein